MELLYEWGHQKPHREFDSKESTITEQYTVMISSIDTLFSTVLVSSRMLLILTPLSRSKSTPRAALVSLSRPWISPRYCQALSAKASSSKEAMVRFNCLENKPASSRRTWSLHHHRRGSQVCSLDLEYDRGRQRSTLCGRCKLII